jgi:hypothetical protein
MYIAKLKTRTMDQANDQSYCAEHRNPKEKEGHAHFRDARAKITRQFIISPVSCMSVSQAFDGLG